MTAEDLPTVAPESFRERGEFGDRTAKRTWGVVLAAGESSRFGEENKLLADLDGVPLVRRAVAPLVESSLDGVTVVVGHERDRIRPAIDDLPVEIRTNSAYETGQSTSVREGVRAARDHDADGVLFALGDMPAVDVASMDLLLEAYEYGVADALAAACDGQRGNPVLFDQRFFDRLADVEGDVGGRELLTDRHGARAVETGDPGVLRDVDRASDLEDLR
ncbi:nucleotidyltransferase family protein [Halorientalis halophila]|uniref:nucleotidyltransferase family protein n=1 Tax=Halorientalis halophila TaxID=3108499 RepID=UPI003009D305